MQDQTPNSSSPIDRRGAGRPANDPGPQGWDGAAINLILEDYGWSQGNLAAAIGLTTSVVGTWCGFPSAANSRPPSRSQVRMVCVALDAPRAAFGSVAAAQDFLATLEGN